MRSAIAIAAITLAAHAAVAAPPRCSHATALQLAHKLASRFGNAAARSTEDAGDEPADDPTDTAGHARIDGPPRDDGNMSGYLIADCVAGRFGGKATYFVVAFDIQFPPNERHEYRRRALFTADGAVVGTSQSADLDKAMGRLDDHQFAYQVADLDGDGRDEVLVTDHFEHHALASSTAIQVVTVSATGALTDAGEVTVDSGGTQWPSCSGTGAVVPAGRQSHIVVTATAGDASCPKPGPHAWGLVHGKVAEIH